MMRIAVLIAFFLMASPTVFCQVVGSTFPQLSGETADDKTVSLPQDAAGKYTFIAVAHSRRSQDQLGTWLQPVFDKFIQKSEGLFSFPYDVNVYFIPMFSGLNAAAAGTAKKRAAASIDPVLLPYIIFYKGDISQYKESLQIQQKDSPYFFVLNAEGKIVHATSGPYTEAKMEALEENIE
jgi:hypothetical protein